MKKLLWGLLALATVTLTLSSCKKDPVIVTDVEIVEGTSRTIALDEPPVQLHAVVKPENAEDQNVSWTSSHPAIAEVAADGTVTPKAEGSTIVTVTTRDGRYTDTIEIIVKKTIVHVSSVSLVVLGPDGNEMQDPSTLEGLSLELKATVNPENASDPSLIWTIVDANTDEVTTEMATVEEIEGKTMLVTHFPGTINVTATSNDNPNAKATVQVFVEEVEYPVEGISLNTTAHTFLMDGSATENPFQLVPIFDPVNATIQTVTWLDYNPIVGGTTDEPIYEFWQRMPIFTIDAEGLVTPQRSGKARVMVESTNRNHTAFCDITVVVPAQKMSIYKKFDHTLESNFNRFSEPYTGTTDLTTGEYTPPTGRVIVDSDPLTLYAGIFNDRGIEATNLNTRWSVVNQSTPGAIVITKDLTGDGVSITATAEGTALVRATSAENPEVYADITVIASELSTSVAVYEFNEESNPKGAQISAGATSPTPGSGNVTIRYPQTLTLYAEANKPAAVNGYVRWNATVDEFFTVTPKGEVSADGTVLVTPVAATVYPATRTLNVNAVLENGNNYTGIGLVQTNINVTVQRVPEEIEIRTTLGTAITSWRMKSDATAVKFNGVVESTETPDLYWFSSNPAVATVSTTNTTGNTSEYSVTVTPAGSDGQTATITAYSKLEVDDYLASIGQAGTYASFDAATAKATDNPATGRKFVTVWEDLTLTINDTDVPVTGIVLSTWGQHMSAYKYTNPANFTQVDIPSWTVIQGHSGGNNAQNANKYFELVPADATNAAMTFTSSNTAVISTIAANGDMTVAGAGTTTITATSSENAEATASVSITFLPTPTMIQLGTDATEELTTLGGSNRMAKQEGASAANMANGSYPSIKRMTVGETFDLNNLGLTITTADGEGRFNEIGNASKRDVSNSTLMWVTIDDAIVTLDVDNDGTISNAERMAGVVRAVRPGTSPIAVGIVNAGTRSGAVTNAPSTSAAVKHSGIHATFPAQGRCYVVIDPPAAETYLGTVSFVGGFSPDATDYTQPGYGTVAGKVWSPAVLVSNARGKSTYAGGLAGTAKDSFGPIAMSSGVPTIALGPWYDFCQFSVSSDPTEVPEYGDFFSWNVVNAYGDYLCPGDWHVATQQDFLDVTAALGDGTGDAATLNKFYSAGTYYNGLAEVAFPWTEASQWNAVWQASTSQTRAAGAVINRNYAQYWSGTQNSTSATTFGNAWRWSHTSTATAPPALASAAKQFGMAIRCVKDAQ